ncbi:MAG: hypothetical protein MJZ21_04240 [archaeon]|nr:hypothetical protein [archaeon]
METNKDLMTKCINCLNENFGTAETERFISLIKATGTGFTVSRDDLYKGMTLDQMLETAKQYVEANPLQYEKATIL